MFFSSVYLPGLGGARTGPEPPSTASNRPRMPAQAETGMGASLISCQSTRPSTQRKCGSTLGNGARRPSAGFLLHTIVLTRRVPQPGQGSSRTKGGTPIGTSSRAIRRARHAAMSSTPAIASSRDLRCGEGRDKRRPTAKPREGWCKIASHLPQGYLFRIPRSQFEVNTDF